MKSIASTTQGPYLTKYGEVDGFTVWIVDGFYIRRNIDINFNNWGHHFRFNFIPKKEIWLDRQDPSNEGEEKYFIQYILLELKMVSEGRDFKDAIAPGEKIEREAREKNEKIKKLKEKLQTNEGAAIEEVHKELWGLYSNNKVKVYVVDSFLVRSLFYLDWVAGGHDKVYPAFIPAGEVWIDNDLVDEEKKYLLLHELHERRLMASGQDYETAHNSALKIEAYCYKNPAELEAKIREELAKQN